MKCHIRSCAAVCTLAAMAPALPAPGDLDPTFGNGGRVFFDDPTDDNRPAGGLLLPDGRIVVGRSNSSVADDFSVLRFLPDGSPDVSFNQDGRSSLDLPGLKATTQLVFLQPDGRIVALGWIRESSGLPASLGMVRYLADGSLDATAGDAGLIRLGSVFPQMSVSAVMLPDGRLVIGGHLSVDPWDDHQVALARFDTNGRLDRSFGVDGYAYANGANYELLSQVIRQADGSFLAFVNVEGALTGTYWYDWRPAVVKFDSEGRLDTAFGFGGRAPLLNETWLTTAVVRPDGRIVAAMASEPLYWDIFYCGAALTRVQADGRQDPTFGFDGVSDVFLDSCQSFGSSSVLEPDGKILISGWNYGDLVVTRVNDSGTLDASFGVGGQAVIDTGDGANLPYADWDGALLRQDDGKVLVLASSNSRLLLARLLPNGGAPGLVGIERTNLVAVEGDGSIDISVRRSGGSEGAVSVDYATSSGSATSNVDFTPAHGTLHWADGDRGHKIISIAIALDSLNEGREEFRFTLANVTGGASLATSDISISIDPPPPPLPPPPPAPPPQTPSYGGGAMSWEFLLVLALALLGRPLTSRAPRAGREPPADCAPSRH